MMWCQSVFTSENIFSAKYSCGKALTCYLQKVLKGISQTRSGELLVHGSGCLLLQPVQIGHLYTHTHTHDCFWVLSNHWNSKSRVNSRSDLVAPSTQQVKTHGVIVSECEGTLQMPLSGQKNKQTKKTGLSYCCRRFLVTLITEWGCTNISRIYVCIYWHDKYKKAPVYIFYLV